MAIIDESQFDKLNKEVSEFKEIYKKELERASKERELQAKIESENAEKEAQQEVDRQKQKESDDKLKAEKEAQEKEELTTFRQSVIDSLNALEKKDNSQTLTNLDNKLSTLVQTLENQEKKEEVSHFTDLVILFFLLGCIPVYLCYRGLYKFFSDTIY